MIMHRTKDKVLVEFPVRLLEKEMLLASSIINISDNGEGVVGQFTSPEVMFRFVRNGKKLEARMMTNQPLMREETGKEGVASSLLKSASGGVYKSHNFFRIIEMIQWSIIQISGSNNTFRQRYSFIRQHSP